MMWVAYIAIAIAIICIIIALRCIQIDYWVRKYATTDFKALNDTKLRFTDTMKHHRAMRNEFKQLKKHNNNA